MSTRAAVNRRKREAREAKKHEAGTQKAGQVYQEVLGREMTGAEGAQYWADPMKFSDLKKHLATSDEAQRKGVDPTSHGVREVDPERLGSGMKEFYDVWKENNGGRPFYDTDLQTLRWQRGEGDINAYRAQQAGAIYDQEMNGHMIRVVTPEAIEMMGGSMTLWGGHEGRLILAPTDVGYDRNTLSDTGLKDVPDGMRLYVGTGHKDDGGLLGSIGLSGIIPKEFMAAVDITGIGSRLLGGEKMEFDRRNTLAEWTGTKPHEVGVVGDIAAAVAITMVTAGAGGPWAGTALMGTHQGSKVVGNEISFKEALVNTGAFAAGAHAGAAATAAEWSRVGVAAAQVGGQAVGYVAGEALGVRTDWENFAINSAASIGGAAAGNSMIGQFGVAAGIRGLRGGDMSQMLASGAVGAAGVSDSAVMKGGSMAWQASVEGFDARTAMAVGGAGYVAGASDSPGIQMIARLAPTALTGQMPGANLIADSWRIYQSDQKRGIPRQEARREEQATLGFSPDDFQSESHINLENAFDFNLNGAIQ